MPGTLQTGVLLKRDRVNRGAERAVDYIRADDAGLQLGGCRASGDRSSSAGFRVARTIAR